MLTDICWGTLSLQFQERLWTLGQSCGNFWATSGCSPFAVVSLRFDKQLRMWPRLQLYECNCCLVWCKVSSDCKSMERWSLGRPIHRSELPKYTPLGCAALFVNTEKQALLWNSSRYFSVAICSLLLFSWSPSVFLPLLTFLKGEPKEYSLKIQKFTIFLKF